VPRVDTQERAAAMMIEPIQGDEGFFIADDDAWAAGSQKPYAGAGLESRSYQ
jgi:acetylornithine/succinyldiaminopimelate/putrescine aminotransferase